jgi:hypothetical protein
MIDPLTALAGIQSAIKTVKKATQVAQDLGSLAPMIGKMCDAKSTATKAMVEAKKTGGSNMGTAIQIEMALEQARAFEEELKMLFMQSGKIDVWNKIKERAQLMDIEDAHEARRAKEAAKKKKEKEQEQMAIVAASFILILLLLGGIFAIQEVQDYCAKAHCGR